jgi:hypothetical protein
MARRRVSKAQFKLEENEVIHIPTNARWTAYPGRPEPHLYSRGCWEVFCPMAKITGERTSSRSRSRSCQHGRGLQGNDGLAIGFDVSDFSQVIFRE